MQSGVIVLATGCDPYEPQYGEYGYGVYPEVMTLQQLIRLLDPMGRPADSSLEGGRARRIAFIHCVGARQIEGVNQRQPDGRVKDYCARICCTATLHTALSQAPLSGRRDRRFLPGHPHLWPGARGLLRACLRGGDPVRSL